ncbi:unnamed protein product, partial [Symbiodinium necroappetens]
MAPVLGFIEGLLEVISGGFFDPDRTRSGRWIGCRSFDDAVRKLSDASGAGGLSGLHSEEEAGPSIAPEVYDVWNPEEPLEPGDATPRSAALGPEPASSEERQVSDCDSSSASLQDEEESEDAERMAELAGEQVAETIQGAADVGLSQGAIDTLRAKGWGTHANFAFSTAVIPGQGDDSVFVRDVITAVLGDADHASAAALRRLHFESYTLAAAELKRQTENTESDVPRKLPPTEISSRIDALQTKILPLRIEDSLEPSHAVVNLVCQCVEDQRVRYLELCRVTTRNQEVNSLKEVPSLRMLQPDRSGMLKAVASPDALRTK